MARQALESSAAEWVGSQALETDFPLISGTVVIIAVGKFGRIARDRADAGWGMPGAGKTPIVIGESHRSVAWQLRTKRS